MSFSSRHSQSLLAPASIAPDFTLPSTIDNPIRLTDLKGKPIILVFYPGDFTPVCGDQLTLYNEVLPLFEGFDAQILGVILGLVIGKPIGIGLLSWIALRTGLAEMPGDLHFRQLLSASLLAGMGFTLSLFIANAAFGDAATLAAVKLNILVASILAGVLGTGALLIFSRKSSETTQLEPVPAAD